MTVTFKYILQVPSEDLWLHPRLVVACTLHGVEPNGEHGWSQASKDYFLSLLTTYKYKLVVSFLAQKGDLYTVSLKKGNVVSVADNLLLLQSGQVNMIDTVD